MSVNHKHILKFPLSQIAKISETFLPQPPTTGMRLSKASLVYRAGSRTGKATQGNPESSALNKDSTTDIYILTYTIDSTKWKVLFFSPLLRHGLTRQPWLA